MSPFEVLYGRTCKTPISWSDPVNKLLIGPDMLKDMEQEIQVIRRILIATHDNNNNKTYVNQHRVHKEFQVGEHIFLQVRPKNISLKFGSCTKLAPQFFGPFEVLERIGPMAYKLTFPPSNRVHDVFHVSLLKSYVQDVNHVIDWFVLQVEPEGEFQQEPLCILDWRQLTLRNRAIEQVKVQCSHFGPEEATWEMVGLMQETILSYFLRKENVNIIINVIQSCVYKGP